MNRELIKLQLMARGMPEWQATMIAAEIAEGASAAREDARVFAQVHDRRGLPEREPTARERKLAEDRDRAEREKAARDQALADEARRQNAEWALRRDGFR